MAPRRTGRLTNGGGYRIVPPRAWIAFGLAVLLMSGPGAMAQTTSGGSESHAAIAAQIEQRVDVAALLAQCPADLSDRMSDRFDVLKSECAESPSSCLAQCLDGDSSDACFGLARWFQLGEGEDDRPHETLFARACTLHRASGCTNRAAGMLNFHGDAALLHPDGEETVGDCVARTFRETCEAGDSWGCTMYGYQLYSGENVPKDLGQAKSVLTEAVSYTHLTLPTTCRVCRSRWSPCH